MNTQDIYQVFLSSEGISKDTRTLKKGELYIAIEGDNFDGNKFAKSALDKGASHAIVSRKDFEDNRLILVDDTLRTLHKLAQHHRRKLGIPILAITGTNGKTTTKELISTVLKSRYKTKATEGNLNNHIGVPLTLLSMNSSTEVGIVEMGASGLGEIKTLCEIAEPNMGLITNIGKAHLEGFGSVEGVKTTKGQLFDYLRDNNGTAFYNADNLIFADMNKPQKQVHYGTSKRQKIYGELIENNEGYLCATVNNENDCAEINTKLVGDYNLENLIAAVAVGIHFGIDIKDIAKELAGYSSKNNRSEVEIIDSKIVIWDCYNANPSSMASALKNLCNTNTEYKKTAILGEMLELGEDSDLEHKKIINILKTSNIHRSYLIGNKYKAEKLDNIFFFDTFEEFAKYLQEENLSDAYILVKGSRGAKLERVKELLQN
ncbi:MAG: UDP-N-acetylmuramoyl-tripeptide--D-alanyl-D-alanine ligase [Bacteroidales bacterium]